MSLSPIGKANLLYSFTPKIQNAIIILALFAAAIGYLTQKPTSETQTLKTAQSVETTPTSRSTSPVTTNDSISSDQNTEKLPINRSSSTSSLTTDLSQEESKVTQSTPEEQPLSRNFSIKKLENRPILNPTESSDALKDVPEATLNSTLKLLGVSRNNFPKISQEVQKNICLPKNLVILQTLKNAGMSITEFLALSLELQKVILKSSSAACTALRKRSTLTLEQLANKLNDENKTLDQSALSSKKFQSPIKTIISPQKK